MFGGVTCRDFGSVKSRGTGEGEAAWFWTLFAVRSRALRSDNPKPKDQN